MQFDVVAARAAAALPLRPMASRLVAVCLADAGDVRTARGAMDRALTLADGSLDGTWRPAFETDYG